jgi:hypothetical protein
MFTNHDRLLHLLLFGLHDVRLCGNSAECMRPGFRSFDTGWSAKRSGDRPTEFTEFFLLMPKAHTVAMRNVSPCIGDACEVEAQMSWPVLD